MEKINHKKLNQRSLSIRPKEDVPKVKEGSEPLNMRFVLASLLFVLTFFFIIYYILVPGRVDFHSDCADTIMWAKAGYDANSILNPDFDYACLLPFGTSLIMQLFMGITGFSYTTHAIGMIAFFILFSAAFIFMLRQMDFDLLGTAAAYSSLMFLMSASAKLREIFWGHTIYYSLGLLFLFAGMGLVLAIIKRFDLEKIGVRGKIYVTALVLLCALASLNGTPALTLFVLPVMAAIIGTIMLDFDNKFISVRNLKKVILCALIGLAMVVGLAVGQKMAGDISAGYESAFSRFDASNVWLDHLHRLFESWLVLSGVSIKGDELLTDASSMMNIIRIGLNLLIVVIPVYRLFTYEKIKHEHTKMLLIAHWICAALILVGWIFGRLSVANWRLTPILCTSIVVFMLFIKELFEQERYRRLAVLFAVPLLVCSLGAFGDIVSCETNFSQSENAKRIALLERNDCTYGYATFWNANVTSVLTGGEIMAVGVDLNDNGPVIRTYQSERSWYSDQPDVENYFLLLTADEYDYMLRVDPDLITDAVKVDSSDGYYVLIFDHNLF